MEIPDYNEIVYEKLSDILGLKFKSQIKNSGIELQGIYSMQNLISKNEYYLLVVNDTTISFKSTNDFLKEFIKLLTESIESLEAQFHDLNEVKSQERIVDANAVYLENEYIGQCNYKQSKLLDRMKRSLTNDH